MASLDPEIVSVQEERKKMEQRLASLSSVVYDTDLYGATDRNAYVSSIPSTRMMMPWTAWTRRWRGSWRHTLP